MRQSANSGSESSAALPLFGLLALGSGSVLYLLFRPRSLLMFEWFNHAGLMPLVDNMRGALRRVVAEPDGFIVHSVPFALWVLAYMLLIETIWGGSRSSPKTFWKLSLPSIAILSELAQALRLLPGTFDPLDLAALGGAVLLGWFLPRKLAACKAVALPNSGKLKKSMSACLAVAVGLLVLGSEQRSSRTQQTQGEGSGGQNQGSSASQGQGAQGAAQQQGQGSQDSQGNAAQAQSSTASPNGTQQAQKSEGAQGQASQGQASASSAGQPPSGGQDVPQTSQEQGQQTGSASQGQADAMSQGSEETQADSVAPNSADASGQSAGAQGQAQEDSPAQQMQADQDQGAQNSGLQSSARASAQQSNQMQPSPAHIPGSGAPPAQGQTGVPGNSAGPGGSSPFATNGTRGVPRIDPVLGGYVVTPNNDTAPPAADPQQGLQRQPQNFPEFR